jgi:hypothetical protein
MKLQPQHALRKRLVPLLAAAMLCALCGCTPGDIDDTYGKRRGADGGASVNGTGVLADMFKELGHKVTTKRFLSPRIHDYDVIVWAPDDFDLPGDEYQEYFEDWLYRGEGRTLVYIGRDYDAAIAYWEKVQPIAPPHQAVEVARRLAKARANYDNERTAMPESEDCRWFKACRDGAIRHIGGKQEEPAGLGGSWCEASTIDPSQLDIQLRGRLEVLSDPPKGEYGGEFQSEILLASGDDVLVWAITGRDLSGGRIIVVTNGTFLLNLPLVEEEHRKLAGRLIAECGSPTKVVFLESGPGGPLLLDQEPGENYPTGLEAFTVWPIGAILLHFVAVGILYLSARLAIFGRPHELPPDAASDFGRHIRALGELLARTQNAASASARLASYHDKTKRDSGALPQATEKPSKSRR